jgi:uncharacterized protein
VTNLAFPLGFDSAGRTATATDDDHINQMIEQLLFTAPGQRVNRPDFGGGLLQLIFAPNSPELASALEFGLKASLQRWLGDVIDLKSLDVSADDSTLRVVVQYVVRQTGRPNTLDMTKTVPTP